MALIFKYSNAADRDVGSRRSNPDDCVVDQLLLRTGFSATITFEPRLTFIDSLFLGNYSEEARKGWNREAFVCYLIASHSTPNRKLSILETELWSELTWKHQDEIASIFEAKVSGVLPRELSIGEVRFDWLDDQAFLELSMPIAHTLSCGLFESMCLALDKLLVGLWEDIATLAIGVESSMAGKKVASSVFLCHSSKDKRFVRRLAEELKKNQVNVWLDEEQILVGHDFILKMEEGVAEADYVVVVLTPNFVTHGPWAKEEYRAALAKQIKASQVVLLPVLRKDCEVPTLLASTAIVQPSPSIHFWAEDQ
jgi:hypothetical protein